MKDFFKPLLLELEKIHHEGGITVEKSGRRYNFLPLITQCIADLPAKAEIQEMINHNGYNACGYCFHPGISVKGRKGRKTVRYTRIDGILKLRTHQDFLNTYRKINSMTMQIQPTKGIKAISCMIAAVDFDLVNSFGMDYLHCALLGVKKKMLNLWFDAENHKENFYISKRKKIVFDQRLLAIKPPTEINRKPRSISEKAELKGNELRSLLLYYSTDCLEGLLPVRYIKHYQLFSSAIYMLLEQNITAQNLSLADSRLNQFVDQFEELYGSHNITMNMHLLKHMANCVRRLGPLWSQSSFAFETNNGVIVRSTQAKRDFLHQISWKYSVKSTLESTKYLYTANKNLDRIVSLGSKKNNFEITTRDLTTLNNCRFDFSNEVITVFESIIFKGTKYTSQISRVVSTMNSCDCKTDKWV